ncbi:terminase large subunit domain-containing protein [Erwinia sp. OPT-41]|uniref:Terminase family protein n=1 Tax=Erwinia plantamica TaxID=3237104 RepID=A0ABW7CL82_9GAMM
MENALIKNLDNLSDEEQLELLELLEAEDEYSKTHRLFEYSPYKKQREFLDAGAEFTERCFMAGNQLGKTWTGGAEVAFHLTGSYPGTAGYPADGAYEGEWRGRRFNEPVVFWVGGETNETVTKSTQRVLCGRIDEDENQEPGYGSIPKDDIISYVKSPFFPGLIDRILVKHHNADGVEDGASLVYFKPYSQGRARWQADTVHGVWFDEEPPYAIYSEGLTRTNKYGQYSILTFTPLMGMSDVVTKFLKNPSKAQKVVSMTIHEAEHYTPEQREQIIASYPEHEREARAQGIPTMGSGRIFQITEETIKCQPFECPEHFYVINGQDFGWDHPQAHVQIWWDKDADIFYLARAWKARQTKVSEAWAAVKGWSKGIPTAWPHDGYQHEKGGGEELRATYVDAGFLMLPEHATWPDGGNAVEPGITELRDLMTEGRLKVFNTCEPFFDEFRLYHRDENGKIVKLNDDIISALRYAYMMRRSARQLRNIRKPKQKKIPAPIRPIQRGR